jgi:hypothetical protein
MGEGETREDFSSLPTREDKAANDDRGSRWRRQGGAEGGSPVVTGAMACMCETG